MFGGLLFAGSSLTESDITPYVYTEYEKFLSGRTIDRSVISGLLTKTTRTTSGEDGNSRGYATVGRYWTPPRGVSAVISSVMTSTVILITAHIGSSVSAPTQPKINGTISGNTVVDGITLSTTNLFTQTSSSQGSIRGDIGYYNSDINSIEMVSAVFQANTATRCASQYVVILPGRWEEEDTLTDFSVDPETDDTTLRKDQIALFWNLAVKTGGISPTLGGGVVEIGRNSHSYFNSIVFGMATALATTSTFSVVGDTSLAANTVVGTTKLRLVG